MNTPKRFGSQNVLLLLSVVAVAAILLFDPRKGEAIIVATMQTLADVGVLVITMFLLLGMLQVWLESGKAKEAISKSAGWKSIVYAYVFGTLVMGPIYPGFALGKMLKENGTRVSVIVIMLSVWATTKVALLPLEVQLLGVKFAAIRWVVTLIAVYVLGVLCELLLKLLQGSKREPLPESGI